MNIRMDLYVVLLTSVIIGSLIGRGSADIMIPINSSACTKEGTTKEKNAACYEDCTKEKHFGILRYGFCSNIRCICNFYEFTP
uniref:Venom protein n=1 Tax=Centruroides hentzi TaxID=88313 RepID=A0A2I9LPZ9_9SCOR